MSQTLRNPSAQLNAFPVNDRLGILYTAGRNTNAVATVDQTVNNSATLVYHNELGIYLGTQPKTRYYIRATIQLAIAAAANNLRYAFQGPDGLVIDAGLARWFGTFIITGVVNQVDSNQTALGVAVTGGTTNAWTQLIIEGVVRPEQAGYFGFQFAQNVAAATNTTVKAGSSL